MDLHNRLGKPRMTKGQEPSSNMCWAVIRMVLEEVPINLIMQYTDLCLKTIGKIQQRYHDTGDPTPGKRPKNMGNRGCMLGVTELKVRVEHYFKGSHYPLTCQTPIEYPYREAGLRVEK
ncbi:hypothetical protein FRC04_001074 [Tulasnella sp. 424]|nr:hypothetical protein FRC04_001074 [Tulasnella sp. 424]KAG8969832.1 hypothetical protein FRC05_000809 [Tulasnella sp. 425]